MQSTETTPLLQSQAVQVNLTIERDNSIGNGATLALQHQSSFRPVPVSFAWQNLTVRYEALYLTIWIVQNVK